MKGRDERSRGIEIHIADAFAIIKPAAPSTLRNTKLEGNNSLGRLFLFLRRCVGRGFDVDSALRAGKSCADQLSESAVESKDPAL